MTITLPLKPGTGDKLGDLELLGQELQRLAAAGEDQLSGAVVSAAHIIGCEILNILKGRERPGQLDLA